MCCEILFTVFLIHWIIVFARRTKPFYRFNKQTVQTLIGMLLYEPSGLGLCSLQYKKNEMHIDLHWESIKYLQMYLQRIVKPSNHHIVIQSNRHIVIRVRIVILVRIVELLESSLSLESPNHRHRHQVITIKNWRISRRIVVIIPT